MSLTKEAYGFDQGSGYCREKGIQVISVICEFELKLIIHISQAFLLIDFDLKFLLFCWHGKYLELEFHGRNSHMKNYRPESMNAVVV